MKEGFQMGDLLIYALVVLLATASGSSTGLGGGVVIKPLFDIVSNAPTARLISIRRWQFLLWQSWRWGNSCGNGSSLMSNHY